MICHCQFNRWKRAHAEFAGAQRSRQDSLRSPTTIAGKAAPASSRSDHLHRVWCSLTAFYWSTESSSRDSATAALVAVVMFSCWLPLQFHRAVKFTHGNSPVAWAAATFLLGPVGALFVPAILAFGRCQVRSAPRRCTAWCLPHDCSQPSMLRCFPGSPQLVEYRRHARGTPASSELAASAQSASRIALTLGFANRQAFERIDCAADLHIR